MSVIVVGDSEKAVLACDTHHEAFGPLHVNYHTGHAADEMREFNDSIDGSAKNYNREELKEMFQDFLLIAK